MTSLHDQSDAVERLAAGLGVKIKTRYKWRDRKAVPARWHIPILKAASEANVEIDLEALANFQPRSITQDVASAPQCDKMSNGEDTG